jgi:restriction system protein
MSPRNKKVTIGTRKIDETALLGELKSVQQKIQTWAKAQDLWHDASFLTPYTFHDEPPRRDQVLLLMMEQSLDWTIGAGGPEGAQLGREWTALLEELGFWFALENHYTISLYPAADVRMDEFLSMNRWHWLQHLAEKKMVQLHGEVFEHFAKHPEDLQRIEWRQFEELLDAIFKNQGYYTDLGTGRNDGGVDLRLYQNRAIPELVTLVQAKRYKTPIKLDAVAALIGIAAEQRAVNAIFATTSYFQPKARKYARSVEQRVDLPNIELVDANRLAGWCGYRSKLGALFY